MTWNKLFYASVIGVVLSFAAIQTAEAGRGNHSGGERKDVKIDQLSITNQVCAFKSNHTKGWLRIASEDRAPVVNEMAYLIQLAGSDEWLYVKNGKADALVTGYSSPVGLDTDRDVEFKINNANVSALHTKKLDVGFVKMEMMMKRDLSEFSANSHIASTAHVELTCDKPNIIKVDICELAWSRFPGRTEEDARNRQSILNNGKDPVTQHQLYEVGSTGGLWCPDTFEPDTDQQQNTSGQWWK